MTNWSPENIEQKRTKYILFLISPVVGFLHSLRSVNTKSTYLVFFLFALCFGMTLTIETYDESAIDKIDAGRYRLDFEQRSNMSSGEFIQSLEHYFQFDDGDKDFYFITMVYLVSRFTDNYHFLFLSFAAVFAFFQLKSLNYLTHHQKFDNSFFCIILVFLFTWNQIFNINAMRFYTAAWVAVYAIFKIFLNRDKRYFLLLFVTPFFHSSFWLLELVVVVAFFLKRFEWFWIVVFFLSFVGSTIFAELLNAIADYLPSFLSIAAGYTSIERLFEDSTFSGSGFYWIPMVFDRMYKVYTNVLVVFLIFQRKTLKTGVEKDLYLFVVVFMAYINFAMPIPALGRRSIVMAYPVIAYLWLACYGNRQYHKFKCVSESKLTKMHSREIQKNLQYISLKSRKRKHTTTFGWKRIGWLIYAMPFVWFWQIHTYVGYYLNVLNLDFFIASPIYLIAKYLIVS